MLARHTFRHTGRGQIPRTSTLAQRQCHAVFVCCDATEVAPTSVAAHAPRAVRLSIVNIGCGRRELLHALAASAARYSWCPANRRFAARGHALATIAQQVIALQTVLHSPYAL
jgi:hypothetical protein